MFVHRKQDLSLSEYADDIKMAEKQQNMVAMWKNLMKNVDIDETTSVLGHIHLGWHSTWMQTNETIIEQNTNMFESRILAGATENYRSGGILHTDGSVATWRACSKLCWTILWIGKQESGAILQSSASLFGWSSMTTGGTGISWRIVRSLLASCLEMLLFGTNWTTWHLVVSEQACKDQSQTGFGHVTND